MKIKKISYIKNIGSYRDFTRDDNLSEFNDKWNIFYGYNGSGKTTLSELIRSISEGGKTNNIEKKFNGGSFLIKTSDDNIKDFSEKHQNIKVFNKEFIEESVFGENGANYLLYLGKDVIEQKGIIEELKQCKKKISDSIDKIKEEISKFEKEKDTLLTNQSKIIRDTIGGVFTATHIKPLLTPSNENIQILKKEDLKTCKQGINEGNKSALGNINEFDSKQFIEYYNYAKVLLKQSVSKSAIEEFFNPQISQRIKEGLNIHEGKNRCAFCGSEISDHRKQELKGYFDENYNRLLKNINQLLETDFDCLLDSDQFVDGSNLFNEFQEEYKTHVVAVKAEFENIKTWINSIKDELKDKKNKMVNEVEITLNSYNFEAIEFFINEINSLINKHNKKSGEFESDVNDKKEKIKNHYVAKIFDKYKSLLRKIKMKNKKIPRLEKNIADIISKISQIESLIKPEAAALKIINNNIENILGHNTIKLEIKDTGYKIIRGDAHTSFVPSEGEKMAIGFAYFLVKIYEASDGNNTDIVIFDDPLSSLDEELFYRIYSVICSLDGFQMFIFTHHYKFLRILIDNFSSKSTYSRGGNDVTYYRIKKISGNSLIDVLDEGIFKYKSEYEFLLKTLNTFYCDSTRESNHREYLIDECYNYANMARKVIEMFGELYEPNKNISDKLLKLINMRNNKRESNKLNEGEVKEKYIKIYSFINHYSHYESLEGIKSYDMTIYKNTLPEIIGEILRLLQSINGEHFVAMTS